VIPFSIEPKQLGVVEQRSTSDIDDNYCAAELEVGFGRVFIVYGAFDTSGANEVAGAGNVSERLSEAMLERLAMSEPDRLLAMIESNSLSPGWLGIALEMAGDIEDSLRVIPVAQKYLTHKSPAVREGAVTALGCYMPETQSILRKVFEDDVSPGVRTAALVHLDG
jgi:hypothetical protein